MIQKDNQPIMEAGFTTLWPNSHITQNLAILTQESRLLAKKTNNPRKMGSRQYHHLWWPTQFKFMVSCIWILSHFSTSKTCYGCHKAKWWYTNSSSKRLNVHRIPPICYYWAAHLPNMNQQESLWTATGRERVNWILPHVTNSHD